MSDSVRQFWAKRVRETNGRLRWTGTDMLEHDMRVILDQVPSHATFTWMDLGCGTGELQRGLRDRYEYAIGIDAEPGMAKYFPVDSRTTLVVMAASEVSGAGDFDIVSAFGLVTYLTSDEEMSLYARMAQMTRRGTVLVKNQCSRRSEKTVNQFSSDLRAQYWARYPAVYEQGHKLGRHFMRVEFKPYPARFNRHSDTLHGCFVCSRPLPVQCD